MHSMHCLKKLNGDYGRISQHFGGNRRSPNLGPVHNHFLSLLHSCFGFWAYLVAVFQWVVNSFHYFLHRYFVCRIDCDALLCNTFECRVYVTGNRITTSNLQVLFRVTYKPNSEFNDGFISLKLLMVINLSIFSIVGDYLLIFTPGLIVSLSKFTMPNDTLYSRLQR